MIEIVNPGPLASIQDLGRTGLRSIGVGSSGAMDARALRIANRMIGNDDAAAGIEFTYGDFEIRFSESVDIAISGAAAEMFIDDVAIPRWWAQTVHAGQCLKAGFSESGMRIYLSVGGGIDVPVVMGACATDLKGGFGGLDGRMLQAGDRLKARRPRLGAEITGFGLSKAHHPGLFADGPQERVVRFVPAAEWDDYDDANQRLFMETDWTVSYDSNRNGSRLEGPQLVPMHQRELLSHGILPGTIQLPPSGQPVVQLQEANTCGGYPKLGALIAADLHRFAQVPLGETVRFKAVTLDEARAADAVEEHRIRAIAR